MYGVYDMCTEMSSQVHTGTLNLPGRNCVLFDFDGTLVDTGRGIMQSLRRALERNGIDPGGDMRRFVGPPVRDALQMFFGLDLAEAERIKDEYRAIYAADGLYDCVPYPGALDCVKALHAAGKKTAVATSKPTRFARILLEKFGFLPFFDAVCGAESDAHAGKAEIVRRALDALGAKPEEAVMVGDRKYDVLGAAACGVPCIGFAGGYEERGEFSAAGAAAEVSDHAALRALLLGK